MEGAAGNFRRYPLPDDEREDDTARESEVVNHAAKEYQRVDQEPGYDKENRDEKRICEEHQLALCRLVVDGGVNCQTCKECADYARQVDALCEDAGHNHDGKHEDEVGVFVIFRLLQEVRPQTTQSE